MRKTTAHDDYISDQSADLSPSCFSSALHSADETGKATDADPHA